MQLSLFLAYGIVSALIGYRAYCLVYERKRMTYSQKAFTVLYWSAAAAITQMVAHATISN